MELLARTRIVMWEGASLWVVDATRPATPLPRRTDSHSHHAIQLTISLGGTFCLSAAGIEMGGDAVAVAADAYHVFEAEGLLVLLFVEPESRAGRSIAKALFCGPTLTRVPPEMLGDFRERIAVDRHNSDALIAGGRALVTRLSGNAMAPVPDLRVRKAIAWAAQQASARISLSDAVPITGLSAGRLRHLFVEETGLPFKTYLLWLRLMRAVECVAAGASLTEAAHAAGFSDSAHFSRTFRRMFGVTPAALSIF
jgi:AraC-like DNA-binding protein